MAVDFQNVITTLRFSMETHQIFLEIKNVKIRLIGASSLETLPLPFFLFFWVIYYVIRCFKFQISVTYQVLQVWRCFHFWMLPFSICFADLTNVSISIMLSGASIEISGLKTLPLPNIFGYLLNVSCRLICQMLPLSCQVLPLYRPSCVHIPFWS